MTNDDEEVEKPPKPYDENDPDAKQKRFDRGGELTFPDNYSGYMGPDE